MIGKTMDEISIGDSAEFSKTVSEADIYAFAGISGDMNPAHVNESYARTTFFKSRIAHGILSAGFISACLGMQLPGAGAIYIRQELNFLAPVRIGDTITARVEVLEKMIEANRIRLRTTCTNQEGTMVIDGEAVVMPRKSKKI